MMGKAKKAKKAKAQLDMPAVDGASTDVPTLAEVAPNSSNQRSSGDLVAASFASNGLNNGPAQNSTTNQGGAFEQVRELLMGESIQSLREDLNTSHRIIIQRVDALGSTASSQLEMLEEKVTALSSDMTAEVSTRKAFADSHRQSMDISASELKRELAEFKSSAQNSMDKLAEDFTQQADFQSKAIENFEQSIAKQMEDKGKSLDDSTVAKDKLAAMLFDAAAAFADPETEAESAAKTAAG